MNSVTFFNMFLLYFFLCIPLFFYAVSTVMEIRKRRRKVRRCFKCGHIGSMEPYLQEKRPYFLTIAVAIPRHYPRSVVSGTGEEKVPVWQLR